MFYQLLIVIHVMGVVIWIGGVAFVTMTVFPMILRMESSFEKMIFFQGVEHRFARIAKACVVAVGITGFLLLNMMGGWNDLFSRAGIGPTVMLVVWTIYLLILLFEGRLFKLIFKGDAQKDTSKIFARLAAFHWVVLGLSLLAVGIGVWAGHGGIQ